MAVTMIVLSMATQKLVSCRLITIIASFHPVVYVDSGASPEFDSLLCSSVIESLLSAGFIVCLVEVPIDLVCVVYLWNELVLQRHHFLPFFFH